MQPQERGASAFYDKLTCLAVPKDRHIRKRGAQGICCSATKDLGGILEHVTLIVNVASKCTLTQEHYTKLSALYHKYSESKGLRIMAFPTNDFAKQLLRRRRGGYGGDGMPLLIRTLSSSSSSILLPELTKAEVEFLREERDRSGGVRYPSYTCSGFKNSANFDEFVNRASVQSNVRFILTSSQLDSIPPRAFAGIRASTLELENVRVNNSLTFDAGGDSFVGLEASLEKIVFSRNSSVPRAWSFSKRMEKLRQVVLFEINRLSLSSSFNELPNSVVEVDVIGSTIQDVDDHWLSSLPNLEAIVIRNSNISSFMRTMLPNPATKLEALLLE
ncbi:hypothetical protein HPB47_004445 [Ixodes persulcatus]|uniref:Uncharacterized protein n=1 Tax=Ixodes persulcatus TaxID=34615 RepID=A0AC60PGQ2_IXOPE|nr:hypothetical protein HPB47_004445 [Ixodes persulcatus]